MTSRVSTRGARLGSEKSVKKVIAMRKAKDTLWSIIRAVLILGISYVILFPIVSKLSSSLMAEQDLYDKTVKWIPRNLTFDNYVLVWQHMKYIEAFFNSLALALIVSILQLVSCTMIGYGLARFKFAGKRLLTAIVVFMLVVPPQVVTIPLYLNFRFFNLFGLLGRGLNLLDSYWPFILMSITGTGLRNGLFIYIMHQFFRGMPRELEEAAYVDGASQLRTFYSVMLPGAVPALVVVLLFSFVWQWNDEYLTSLFLRNRVLLASQLSGLVSSVTKGQMNLTGQYLSLLNNTGCLLFIWPVLLLYAGMQRYFIESVQRTGLVG